MEVGDLIEFDTSLGHTHQYVHFEESRNDIRYGKWMGDVIEIGAQGTKNEGLALVNVIMYPSPPEEDDGLREIIAKFVVKMDQFEWGMNELSEESWVLKSEK